MYVPRRHSRRLLLPPGWVALGFLLLLGCQVLLAHRQRILPKNVLQLSLPPLKSNGFKLSLSLCDGTAQGFDFSYEGFQAEATAQVNGHWHDFTLIGNAADSLSLLTALVAIRAIKSDTGHAGGVRVLFYSGVAYQNLTSLLDLVNHLQLKASWLDIRRSPAVFYAVVSRPMTLAERRCYKANECQGMGDGAVAHTVEPPLTLTERFKNLRRPERRPLLLVAVGSIVLLLSASVAQGLLSKP